MNIDRNRPPKDCDLGVWLSGTINDAVRDAIEAGLDHDEAVGIVRNLASILTTGNLPPLRHADARGDDYCEHGVLRPLRCGPCEDAASQRHGE